MRVQAGDTLQLGAHRLYCGDALDETALRQLLSGSAVDLVFADPPYGMRTVKSGNHLSRRYRAMAGDDSNATAARAFAQHRTLGARHHVFWGANFYAPHVTAASCWLVWDKRMGNCAQAHCELAWTDFPGQVRCFEWPTLRRNRVHPAQKPVELVRWAVEQCPGVVNTVFDPFAGAGTALMACEMLRREGAPVSCHAMEIDETYCEHIVARWEAFAGKRAVLATRRRPNGVSKNGISWRE